MSPAKSWIVKSVRRRLGWTLVIAGAAVITALVMGDSPVSAVVAVGIVIALSALIPSRRKRASDADYPGMRAPGRPYLISHAWNVDRRANLAEMAGVLNGKGFELKQECESPDEVVLRGGSQLWTRLFGGYFVNPKHLPIEVELKTASRAGNGQWTVQLVIRDKLGMAVRDKALEDRFAQVAGSVRGVVEDQLEPLGGVEIDSVPHRDN